MMKVLKYFVVGFAVVFVLVFIGSLFLAKAYSVERSTVIRAPADRIFPLMGDLRNWSQWSPWHELDPDMEITYASTTTGVGGGYSWTGEKAGTGSMEIREFEPPSKMTLTISFEGWEDNPSTSSLTLSPTSDGQTVTWKFEGEFKGNPIQRYFGLLFEKMVGSDYEKGLANLKTLVESQQ